MMSLNRPRLAAACLTCLVAPALLACGPDLMLPDESEPAGLSLEELTDDIEMPADSELEPTDQTCERFGAAAPCLDGESAAFCGVFDYETSETGIRFGACIPLEEVECVPGETRTIEYHQCGEVEVSCYVWDGVPTWSTPTCETEPESGDTPLVLRFDDAPVTLIDAEATPAATFDIAMAADRSSCIVTDWPTAATPWLAIDLDHSGSIDGGHELFGSGTRLGSRAASNGFEALAAYDQNGDGWVDARDPRFGDLLLWRDYDADRASTPAELEPLTDAGVERLKVDYTLDRQCDTRGNCGIERASFGHAGGVGEIVDLHLGCQ